MRYNQANAANQLLRGLGNTADLRLGLAYRDPSSDKFNALLRYEYRKNSSVIPDTILLGSGTGLTDHTFALEGIYALNWQWEFYGKFAIRNSTSYLAEDLVGAGTTSLAQLRTTYRLGYRVDLVGEARWINQLGANYSEMGFLVEAGYYMSPNLRFAAGYSFGEVGDRDFNGSRSAGGPYVGLTLKLDELFDGFGRQKPLPAEAAPKPATVQIPASSRPTDRPDPSTLMDTNSIRERFPALPAPRQDLTPAPNSVTPAPLQGDIAP